MQGLFLSRYVKTRNSPAIPHVVGATVFLLALIAMSYSAGLPGGFIFDDLHNISENPLVTGTPDGALPWSTVLSETAGLRDRFLSILSFTANVRLSGGLVARDMVITNIALHAANSLLVWLLFYGLVRATPDASQASTRSRLFITWLATAVWALHPVNLTSVLYIVQRMNSLATFWMLAGLCWYLCVRPRVADGRLRVRWLVPAVALTPFAIASKENGVLLPLLLLLLEHFVFQWRAAAPSVQIALKRFHGFLTVLPTALGVATFVLLLPKFLEGYTVRDFGLGERLLTQPRVLWHYIEMLLLPDITELSLYHDDVKISRGIFSPGVTSLALVAWLAVGWYAWKLRRHAPLAVFALAFFLGAQALESTAIPLELKFEHRTYLAGAPLLLALIVWSNRGLRRFDGFDPKVRMAIATIFILVLTLATGVRAWTWSSPQVHAYFEAIHKPESVRAQNSLGIVLCEAAANAATPELVATLHNEARRRFERAAHLGSDVTPLLNVFLLLDHRVNPENRAIFEELRIRLSTQSFAAVWTRNLERLVVCQHSGPCELEHDEILMLLDSARNNPTASWAVNAYLQFVAGFYLSTVPGRWEEAVHRIEASLAIDDRGNRRLDYVQLLLQKGKVRKAAQELGLARPTDNDTDSARIQYLERRIREAGRDGDREQ